MNNSFEARFLAHATLASFRQCVIVAVDLITKTIAKCRNPYIAISAGKDSTVVADLVWRQRPETPGVYFDAKCAYPEVTDWLDAREREGRTIVRHPCKPFLEILAEHGLHSDKIEKATMEWTVYEPLRRLRAEYNFDAVFLGLRSEESPGRKALIQYRSEIFARKDGVLECNPIGSWTFADVWAYLVSRHVPYCVAYDKLFGMGLPEKSIRLSYWAGESGRRWGRYEALKRGWPDLWQRLCDVVPEAKGY